MTHFKKIASLLVLLVGLAALGVAQQGQNSLTQTTLASAVTGPALYSGTSPTIQQTVYLASVSGISAPLLPGTPVSIIYVDREAMAVWAVNTSLSSVTVSRGYLGTQASPHVSGDMVLVAPVYNPANGGNPVPNGLFGSDPPQGGTCSSGVPTIPWVNVITGAQWLCSTITNTWVPGFNNPLSLVSAGLTTSVASVAGATLPSGPLFIITGTNAVTGWTIPVGFNATSAGYGCFSVIGGSGPATWTAAGNIAVAGTFTANKLFVFCWNPSTSKFQPSATS